MTPAWQKYWSDGKSPHPDVGRAHSDVQRVLAAFSKDWKSHYCHHYRKVGEHYHRSMEELEACPL